MEILEFEICASRVAKHGDDTLKNAQVSQELRNEQAVYCPTQLWKQRAVLEPSPTSA